MARVWMSDDQAQECIAISEDMMHFIRRRHQEARARLHLTDPEFDIDNQLPKKETL